MRRWKSIKVSQSALLGMVVAAIETFPNECMGVVFSLAPGRAWFSIPYQVARRSEDSVESPSISKAAMICGNGISIMAEFHSHPYGGLASDEPEPSYQDIKDMRPGRIEFIVRVHKALPRRRKTYCTTNGDVNMSMGRFKFKIRAFCKTRHPRNHKAFDRDEKAYYNQVRIRIAG